MKVYVHLEGQEVSYTVAQYVVEDTTVSDLITSFAEGLKDAYGCHCNVSSMELKDEDGKILNGTKKKLFDILDSGDDLFINMSQSLEQTKQCESANVSPPSEECSTLCSPEENNETQPDFIEEDCVPLPTKSSKSKAKAKARARAKAKAVAIKPTITEENRSTIATLIKEKSYKRARELTEKLLSTIDDKDILCLRALSNILFLSEQYNRCIDICKRGLQEAPRCLEFNYLLAKSYYEIKQYSQARNYVTIALTIQSRSKELLNEPENMKSEDFKFDLIALQSQCVFELGQHNEAVSIINQVTSNTASANNISILVAYSSFALHYNKYEEPTRALLKAVVMSEHPRVRALLARIIASEAGIAEILKQVPISTVSGAPDRRGKSEVYAFLGFIAKTQSVVPGSIRFYDLALKMLPTSASCALNLTHMYEIAADYDAALRCVEAFCRENRSLGLAQNAVQRSARGASSLTCEEFMRALSSPVCTVSTSSRALPQVEFSWVQLEETYGYVAFSSPVEAAPGYEEDGKETAMDAPSPPIAAGKGRLSNKCVKIAYTTAELDLLALFATAAKIIYLQGKLHLLPGILRVLEPCRIQSEKPLHETAIRNEMAYFQQIGQLVCYRNAHASYGLRESVPSSSSSHSVLCNLHALAANYFNPSGGSGSSSTSMGSKSRSIGGGEDLPPLFREAAMRPIYVLGDSHSVCPAWSIVTVQGRSRLLVPRLATGVKQWHLRADSSFYPKHHFQRMAASIPRGSEVSL